MFDQPLMTIPTGFWTEELFYFKTMKTIKVKETKNHRTGKLNWSADNRELLFEEAIVPVAEAKLILVQTNDTTGYSLLLKDDLYKPILISETEKPEEIDDYYDPHYPGNLRHGTNNAIEGGYKKKVLALPEHFSPKLLQDIVDGKLKDGDKCWVECEETNDTETIAASGGFSLKVPVNLGHQIKLNSSDHITLHKLEEKKYELNFIRHITGFSIPEINEKYDKWFNANVK